MNSMKNISKIISAVFVSSIVSSIALFLPFPVFADDPQFTGITNPVIDKSLGGSPAAASNGSIFAGYIVDIWRALIVVGALAVLINFLTGAFTWITNGGAQDKVSHARLQMINSIIGFIILVASFIILSYIGKLFNIPILKLTLPTPGSPPSTP